MQINEQAKRWDDFQGGRAIELPDGQVWHFYEPQPIRRGDHFGWTFGADVEPSLDQNLSDRLTMTLAKWLVAKDDPDRASVVLEASWLFLARNYHVTVQEFSDIMLRAAELPKDRQSDLGVELRQLVDDVCNRYLAFQADHSEVK